MFPRQHRSHVRCNFGQGLKAEIHVNLIEILRSLRKGLKLWNTVSCTSGHLRLDGNCFMYVYKF